MTTLLITDKYVAVDSRATRGGHINDCDKFFIMQYRKTEILVFVVGCLTDALILSFYEDERCAKEELPESIRLHNSNKCRPALIGMFPDGSMAALEISNGHITGMHAIVGLQGQGSGGQYAESYFDLGDTVDSRSVDHIIKAVEYSASKVNSVGGDVKVFARDSQENGYNYYSRDMDMVLRIHPKCLLTRIRELSQVGGYHNRIMESFASKKIDAEAFGYNFIENKEIIETLPEEPSVLNARFVLGEDDEVVDESQHLVSKLMHANAEPVLQDPTLDEVYSSQIYVELVNNPDKYSTSEKLHMIGTLSAKTGVASFKVRNALKEEGVM